MKTKNHEGPAICFLAAALLSFAGCCMLDTGKVEAIAQESAPNAVFGYSGVVFWQERSMHPVPVVLSIVQVDMHDPAVEVATFIADDPDGDGTAESKLVAPVELALRNRALVAVNANAFKVIPNAYGKRSQWYGFTP